MIPGQAQAAFAHDVQRDGSAVLRFDRFAHHLDINKSDRGMSRQGGGFHPVPRPAWIDRSHS